LYILLKCCKDYSVFSKEIKYLKLKLVEKLFCKNFNNLSDKRMEEEENGGEENQTVEWSGMEETQTVYIEESEIKPTVYTEESEIKPVHAEESEIKPEVEYLSSHLQTDQKHDKR
jgi:hypothetical protein